MSVNIVVLSGSPRKNGNTDKLAAAFKEGAESAGKTVTLFRVADMNISGCLGCEYCFVNEGECVHKDDMQQILAALRTADVLVWASPVYYFSVSAQLKTAIDRTYALLKEKPPIEYAALLMTCADVSSETANGAIAMYKNNNAYQNWEDLGIQIVTGVHNPNDIDGSHELQRARKFGQTI